MEIRQRRLKCLRLADTTNEVPGGFLWQVEANPRGVDSSRNAKKRRVNAEKRQARPCKVCHTLTATALPF